jgi:hypothetical protein
MHVMNAKSADTEEKQIAVMETTNHNISLPHSISTLSAISTLSDMQPEQLEQRGREISRENKRLARFAQMLSHPEFATFFDENFQDWSDCQQSIMLLKTGAYIRDTLIQSTGEPISGNQLVTLMKMALDHKDTRQFMIQSLYDFMKSTADQKQQQQSMISNT